MVCTGIFHGIVYSCSLSCLKSVFRSQAETRQSEGKPEDSDLQRRKEEDQKRESLELQLIDS